MNGISMIPIMALYQCCDLSRVQPAPPPLNIYMLVFLPTETTFLAQSEVNVLKKTKVQEEMKTEAASERAPCCRVCPVLFPECTADYITSHSPSFLAFRAARLPLSQQALATM